MDFDAFMTWRKDYAICEMDKAPIKPETCHRVFDELVTEGFAHQDAKGYCRLTPKTDVPAATRRARMQLNKLMADNQRLVRKLVSQLSKRSTAFIEEEDLFQAGLMGFMRALQKFDPDKFSDKKRGASFATYLRHWVRHFMQASMADQQTIKHPRSFGMPYPIHKKMEDILQRTGQAATPEQLGTFKLGKKEYQVTQAHLDMWAAAGNAIVSLDAGTFIGKLGGRRAVGTPDQANWGNANEDKVDGELPDSSKSPESLLTRAQLGVKAEEIVATFDDYDRRMIEEVREGVSAAQTAKRVGITEETVRIQRRDLVAKLTRMMGRAA